MRDITNHYNDTRNFWTAAIKRPQSKLPLLSSLQIHMEIIVKWNDNTFNDNATRRDQRIMVCLLWKNCQPYIDTQTDQSMRLLRNTIPHLLYRIRNKR